MKLFCTSALAALCVIALVACAALTPVPPTPTRILPTLVPIPPTPTLHPLPQATIRVGDLDRTYLAYVPANLPRNAPLLFALHGYTQDVEGMRSWTSLRFESLANQHGFIVVYPSGYKDSWNVCDKFASYPAKMQNVDDVGFIHTLIAKFRADYGINPFQVFAIGVSNGAQMAFRLAFELSDEITGIAAISGNVPTDDSNGCRSSVKSISVLMMHGTADTMIPYDGTSYYRSAQATAEYFAKLNGQTNSPKTARLPHRDASDPTSVDRIVWNDAGKPEVVLYKINGGGHGAFPQGKVSDFIFSGFNMGKATGDLDAPTEIWDFIARQRSLR